MWLYQSHRVVWFGFFKIIFITKEPKLQQLLSCAEKLWIQDTPWTKVITSGTWCKVCVQVIIRAVFRPWEHNGKHLVLDYGSIYAGMWTPSGAAMSCCPPWVARTAQTKAAGLQEAGGSPQATTCRSRWWAFAQGSTLMVWTPDQMTTGMMSQSTGVPVRCILNTMGPLDQQWYNRSISLAMNDAQGYSNTFSHLSLQLPSLKMGELSPENSKPYDFCD